METSIFYGILCALGASVGVITPMIFKASGIFSGAPDFYLSHGTLVIINSEIEYIAAP